jgi:predicted dehydrogenase
LKARGDVCGVANVTLQTSEGKCQPTLEGTWFVEGFSGAMGELLTAIEEGRTPSNSGRNNLTTLALLFAIVQSAETGQPVKPGTARALGDSCRIQ